MSLKVGFEALSLFGHTGIESYGRGLINGFIELDEEIIIKLFTAYGRAKRFVKLFGSHKNIRYKNFFPHPLILGPKLEPVSSGFRNNVLVRLAAKQVDLMHWLNPCYFYDVLDNSVVTIHDIFPFYNTQWAIDAYDKWKDEYCMRYELAFRNARMLFVPTLTVKNEIIEKFPYVNPEKICVTYEAAHEIYQNLQPDYSILKSYDITPESKFFLFVSRFDQRKNIEGILYAISKLSLSSRQTLKFVFIGSARKEEARFYRRVVAMLGIGDSFIHFEGVPNSHLIHFLNAAQALIFPSFAEGFGLPIVEAMQCGCPVITSNVSCMPEIAGDAAIFIDPNDSLSIRDAINQLADDEGLRKTLSEKGIERAKFFSWKNCAEQTLAGYKNAMSIK